jgi:hypothetical protein
VDAARGLSADQVVEVLVSGTAVGYGTGYYLGAGLVLTARHVVERDERVHVRFGTRPAGDLLPAAVAWRGPGQVDLAFLQLEQADAADGGDAALEWGYLAARNPASGAVPFTVIGFPRSRAGSLSDGLPFRDTLPVTGTMQLGGFHKSGQLDLVVTSTDLSQLDWRGMSGAAVFVHDFLVGVVVRAAPSGNRLIAIPVSAALGGQLVRLGEFTAGRDEQQRARGLLERCGLSTRVSPAYRRPYLDTILELNARTPDLRGRELELARLRAWLRSAAPYAVWSGIAWSGKTALAARLAADPPPDTDVASFFVSSARGAQAERLWQVVTDQLAAMLHEPAPADGDREFDQLWRRASQASHDAHRKLLLLIDGIDDLEERPAVRRLLERLPYRPLPGTHVLLLTRPNPQLDRVAAADHPLRGSKCDLITLDPSSDALHLRDRARIDLETVLDSGGIALRALLLMARTGPMAEQDIRLAIGWADAAADQGALRRALTSGPAARLVRQESIRRGQPRFVIGHDALREELTKRADPQAAEADVRRLLSLADDCAARSWPDDTPDFLLEGYPSMLAQRGDTSRLTATLLSPRWLDLARARTHTVLTTATMLREALATMASDPAASLPDLLLLSAHIAELQPPRGDRHLPLISAWAMAGQPEYAEYLTTDVADDAGRARMLAELADQALEAHDRDRAIRLADRALESVRGLPLGSGTAVKASLLVRLQRLAQHLGRVTSAAAAGAQLWEILPNMPADQHEQLWLEAAENAAAEEDIEHVRASAAILGGLSASAATNRRLAAAARRAGDTGLSAQLLDLVRDSDAADRQQGAPSARADDQSAGPSTPRPSRDGPIRGGRPRLAQIYALVKQGHYADAAARIDNYEDEPSSLIDMYSNLGISEVSFLAAEAARKGGSAAVPVVAAAQRFAQRQDTQAQLTWATRVQYGPSEANRLMGASAGNFLAEIAQVAAEHGRLQELLDHAEVSADPAIRVQDFTALALGAARGGCAETADQLLSAARAQAAGSERGACYGIGFRWSRTERWREAIDLVRDYKGTFEPYLLRANAVLTGIRMGDLPGALSVLRECLLVPSLAYTAEGLIASAAVTAAEEGHWPLALSLSAGVESPGPLAKLQADLAVTAHNAEALESAEAFLEEAYETTAEITEPEERIQALAACAMAALELGQATRARKTLFHGTQELANITAADAANSLILLAEHAHQAGDADQCLNLLHRAAAAAPLAPEPYGQATKLSATASAAYEAGAAEVAAALVTQLAGSSAWVTKHCVADLAVTAAKAGDATSAATLLRAIGEAEPPVSLHGLDPKPGHLSMVARAAARARLWPMADEALAALPPDNRIEALAELAQLVYHDEPERARGWICQGLLLGPTPRLLAATACLEPGAAVAAASILLIRSHALSPPVSPAVSRPN